MILMLMGQMNKGVKILFFRGNWRRGGNQEEGDGDVVFEMEDTSHRDISQVLNRWKKFNERQRNWKKSMNKGLGTFKTNQSEGVGTFNTH